MLGARAAQISKLLSDIEPLAAFETAPFGKLFMIRLRFV
jgi:hypothetical protein